MLVFCWVRFRPAVWFGPHEGVFLDVAAPLQRHVDVQIVEGDDARGGVVGTGYTRVFVVVVVAAAGVGICNLIPKFELDLVLSDTSGCPLGLVNIKT